MPRIDLHTHSAASPDGSLQGKDYEEMLASGKLDCIAVTDHDRLDFALALQATLGEQIIVGEEVTTQEGEIIGLYLNEVIPAGLSASEAAARIHAQGGLVYIPHPFETARKGLSEASLDAIASEVDIIEAYNGRTLQNRGQLALQWAESRAIPGAASSDAHGRIGWGRAYSVLTEMPSRKTLVKLLTMSTGSHGSVGIRGRLYPQLNRLRRHA